MSSYFFPVFSSLLSFSYLEVKYRRVDSHVSEINCMPLRDSLEWFLNLPGWLTRTILYAVVTTAYLTSFFPWTVRLWKGSLSDEVYIPSHFLKKLCCVKWGFYIEYITYVCLIKDIRGTGQSHSFRESKSFNGVHSGFWNGHFETFTNSCVLIPPNLLMDKKHLRINY